MKPIIRKYRIAFTALQRIASGRSKHPAADAREAMQRCIDVSDDEVEPGLVGSGDLFGVGASVTWCHSSIKGRPVGLVTRCGTIIDRTEKQACVKYRGKPIWLTLHRFRIAGARTELTDLIYGPESKHD